MTDKELRSALKAWGVPDTDAALRALTDSGKARKLIRYGRTILVRFHGPRQIRSLT